MSARYLAIEAVDLAGKSTQLARAEALLREAGLRVATIGYPDRAKPATGGWIDRYLAGENAAIAALPEIAGVGPLGALLAQALFAVNRREAEGELRTALARYDIVLSSRSDLSGLAYGTALGLDPALLTRVLEAIESDLPRPERYLVLDLDPGDLAARPRVGGLDAFERDRELQSRVRAAYRELADRRGDVTLIDGSGDPEAVASRLEAALRAAGVL